MTIRPPVAAVVPTAMSVLPKLNSLIGTPKAIVARPAMRANAPMTNRKTDIPRPLQAIQPIKNPLTPYDNGNSGFLPGIRAYRGQIAGMALIDHRKEPARPMVARAAIVPSPLRPPPRRVQSRSERLARPAMLQSLRSTVAPEDASA
jgi:hypothetical protein